MDGVGKKLGTVIGRRVTLIECLRTHWRIVYEACDQLGTVAMDLPIRQGTGRSFVIFPQQHRMPCPACTAPETVMLGPTPSGDGLRSAPKNMSLHVYLLLTNAHIRSHFGARLNRRMCLE